MNMEVTKLLAKKQQKKIIGDSNIENKDIESRYRN